MRRVTVPIDMSSQQKSILGIISQRQLIYLLGGGAVLYVIVPKVFSIMPHPIAGLITSFIVSIPVIVAVLMLGFVKKQKYHMYFDQYLLIKLQKEREKGNWRKGKHPKDWMVKLK